MDFQMELVPIPGSGKDVSLFALIPIYLRDSQEIVHKQLIRTNYTSFT
jgi:hypothetical protein